MFENRMTEFFELLNHHSIYGRRGSVLSCTYSVNRAVHGSLLVLNIVGYNISN